MIYAAIFVGAGGFLGAIFRFLISSAFYKFSPNFAYATLFVNSLGSLLIGFILTLASLASINPNLKNFLVVGILGAFTTFSTFSYESICYLNSGEILKFALNVVLNVVLCLIFCYFGVCIAKIIN